MRILVACEESQILTLKLRNLDHEAYSCDIKDTTGLHEEWHIKDDVFNIINDGWDMMIAFPPCTYLTKACGDKWKNLQELGIQQEAMEFVKKLWNSNIKHIAIENPTGILNTGWKKPDQIIQPWMFGEPYRKETCLWLKNLPKLKRTKVMHERNEFVNSRSGYGEERRTIRSKIFNGIAEAMSTQWTKPTKIWIQTKIEI